MNPRTLLATWPGRIAALVVVGAIVGGTMVIRGGGSPAKAELRTANVTRGSVTQTVSVSGSVNALGQARLSFKTGGKLAQVFVSVGQTVTPGQSLAKLDTTDLETAYATAQQNVASAQASYQKQLLSASDTRSALDEAQRSSANDIATAQNSLTKLRTSYLTAKTNLTGYGSGSTADIAAFQTDIDTVKAQLDNVINELLGSNQPEVKSAQTSIYQTFAPIANIAALNTSQLAPAITDYQNARAALVAAIVQFDQALDAGGDTSSAAASAQSAVIAYNVASSRLSSALDMTSSGFGGIQTNVAAAQAQLTSAVTKYIGGPYDQWRSDLSTLYTLVSTEISRVSSAKLKLTQASSAVSTISDVTQGSLTNAIQAVSSAQDRAATSVRSAQSAVANIPFNLQSAQTNVDNATNSLATAKSNLDNAVLSAPSAGIVASIANQIGEFVSGGTTNNAFMVLTNTTSMVLHGTVGEADVAKLRLGQVANVTVDAMSGQKMTGKVTSLDPVATISQGVPVYGIDVAIDVPASGLKAGMSGTAAVILQSKQNVLTVPNTTIRTLSGGRGVQVLKDGEVVDTVVQFGIANDTVTEVVSGLADGDVVVIPQARAGASGQPNRGVQIGGPGQGGGFGR